MTSSSFSCREYLAYAQYSIAANSDEDRYSAVMDHTERGVKSLASFGVFDGHMGVRRPFWKFASNKTLRVFRD